MSSAQKIVFVYNAKSGFMHSMSDLFSKAAKPNSYPCKLCSLTYSGAFMKKIWKEYVSGLDMEAVFLHKDEFAKAYPGSNVSFPTVLLDTHGNLKTLISSGDFKKMNDLTDLIKLMSERLNNATRQQ